MMFFGGARTVLRAATLRATTPSIGVSTSIIRQHIQPLHPTSWVSKTPTIQRMTLITINQSVVDRLKNDGVIPDVIDEFNPSVFLQAEFPSGKEVQLGNTLKEGETQDQPKVIVTPGETSSESADTRYTLCLTDPDAASRDDPKWAEFCHWLVTDIRPTSGTLDLKGAKELMEYMGPAPPENTGKHRYVLLLFKNGKEEPKKLDGRKKWGFEDHDPRIGARHYAKKYDLKLLGANFFFCQNEK